MCRATRAHVFHLLEACPELLAEARARSGLASTMLRRREGARLSGHHRRSSWCKLPPQTARKKVRSLAVFDMFELTRKYSFTKSIYSPGARGRAITSCLRHRLRRDTADQVFDETQRWRLDTDCAQITTKVSSTKRYGLERQPTGATQSAGNRESEREDQSRNGRA